jgi:flagellar basal-body rod modification protein FlgD
MVTVDIKDESGNTVYTEQGTLQAGTGTFSWDGKDNAGNTEPPGTYSISMQAVTAEGKQINVSTETTGVVTGVDFTGSEPVLLVGKSRLNLSGVTSVVQTPAS